jgi:sulfur carrier protein
LFDPPQAPVGAAIVNSNSAKAQRFIGETSRGCDGCLAKSGSPIQQHSCGSTDRSHLKEAENWKRSGYVAGMNVLVNGETREIEHDGELSVDELLSRLDVAQRTGIAVAVNFAVVPKSRWAVEQVSDGDEIEIVRATQGG